MFGFSSQQNSQQPRAKSPARSARLGVESLEERTVLSATLVDGTINITTGDGADTVIVRMENRLVGNRAALIGGGIGGYFVQDVVVEENGVVTGRFDPSQVVQINCDLHQGNDYFRNDTGFNSLVKGGQGDDTLIGGSGSDQLFGRKDNDLLLGRGGLDYLFGEDGNDTLDGGADGLQDVMLGGTGHDTFKAEVGYTGPSIYSRTNLDAPVDFNAAEGDYVDWGYYYALAFSQAALNKTV